MRKIDTSEFIAVLHGIKDYAVPKGWSTIEQIRQELNLSHTRNASSRAFELFKRGLLERIAHQSKAKTGQCHHCYVYRPAKPWRSITEAAANVSKASADKVPNGWVRIMDFALGARISHVAIRGRVERANLKPRYFKTCRGISGLHLNAYYRKADLDRLLRKRP
jgi:predicted transcriptional regulator